MCLKLKLPGHIARVEARVVQSDIEHSDGHILQVFAPIPLQTTLERALHFLVAVTILVYLQRQEQKQMVAREPGRARIEGRTGVSIDKKAKGQCCQKTQSVELG